MSIKRLVSCMVIYSFCGMCIANATENLQSAKQKQSLQKVYTTQQSNVMCTSGAGKIQGCETFSKQLGDAVTEADNAGVPRSETIKTELNAVSDGLKTTQPQRVTPGVAQ